MCDISHRCLVHSHCLSLSSPVAPAWPQANSIISGAAAICGVEELATTGAPRLACAAALRRSRRRQNASPAQRGPRRERRRDGPISARSALHTALKNVVSVTFGRVTTQPPHRVGAAMLLAAGYNSGVLARHRPPAADLTCRRCPPPDQNKPRLLACRWSFNVNPARALAQTAAVEFLRLWLRAGVYAMRTAFA